MTVSLVAHRFLRPSQHRLFKHFVVSVNDEDPYIARCIGMLAESKTRVGDNISHLRLNGHFDLGLPSLTLRDVCELLAFMPNISALTIVGFTWQSADIISIPRVPHLQDLHLAAMLVGTPHDSPLGILAVVPAWNHVHITDIEHTTEPRFFDNAMYTCRTLFIEHNPWAEPAHSLPDHSEKFRGVESVVGYNLDRTHCQSVKQVLRGTYRSLLHLVIVFSPIQSCTFSGVAERDIVLTPT